MKCAALILAAAWLAAAVPAAMAEDDAAVRLYLPRNVKITGEALTLSDIAIVRCEDDRTEARARGLSMGRAPWPKEKLVFDRTTILSCLAGGGVAKEQVHLSGAPAVTVVRQESVLDADRLLAAAEQFLQQQRPDGEKGCVYRILRKPQELVVSGEADVKLSCELAEPGASGLVKVIVTARHEGRQVGLREATFQKLHPVRAAAVVKTIPSGAVLTEENVEVRTEYSQKPEEAGWKAPFGLLARRRLEPGTIVHDALVAEKRPDLVIRRNQVVQIRVEGAGFVIRGMGQALQEGRPGDFIRIRNVDSQRIITARVAFDGSAEPVFRR
ncbi:MAG TPA: flagellar basal body P-ring formation chaperone FlgA [Phycisphaerae bacterium]|nr:flagellar basal body P-ring formation chaperone FlgA [Phycisphaerae bacterium]